METFNRYLTFALRNLYPELPWSIGMTGAAYHLPFAKHIQERYINHKEKEYMGPQGYNATDTTN